MNTRVQDRAGERREPPPAGAVAGRATIRARDIMTADVVTVAPDAGVRDVARSLSENKIGATIVVDGGAIVGIVTEGDLLRREELGTQPEHCAVDSAELACVKSHGRCARDVMTPDVHTVAEQTTLAEIAGMMEVEHVKHLPVMRDGRLVGIVTRADIVRALVARPEGAAGPMACDDDIVRFKVTETLMGIRGASAWLTEVNVSGGIVVLSGAVEDENAREPSRRAIERIPCVVAVDDRRGIMQPY